MSDSADEARLRERVIGILCSPVCQTIHFKVDNVHIQWGMYGYIGSAVKNGFLAVTISGGVVDGFIGDQEGFGISRAFAFTSEEVPADTIVHEGTHAIIFSTNPGLTVTNGTHETAGWLAGTIYRLKTAYPNRQPVPELDALLEQVANRFIAGEANKSAIFTVSPGEALAIKALLRRTLPASYGGGRLDHVETQIELPSRRGGLIRIMRQEQMEIDKASRLPSRARVGLGLSESAIKKVLGK